MQETNDAALIAAARRYERARSRRPILFASSIGADPAWDILIHLLASTLEGRPVGISSAASASLRPPTTGLRWIMRLIKAGLVYREGDLRDGRRMHLRLTANGEALARRAVEDLV